MAETVKKGWGAELWVHNDEKYCGKILRFDAGKKCSLHYHRRKTETFYLQSGRLVIITAKMHEGGSFIDHKTLRLSVMGPGDSQEIPIGTVHQMLALEDSELIEFSTQHFDEDSYRLVKGD